MENTSADGNASKPNPKLMSRLWWRWERTPLYARIAGGLVLGVIAGLLFKSHAAPLDVPAKLVLRLLGALAPPLILVAVIRAMLTAHIPGRVAGRMAYLLMLNTVVAILIGLAIANIVKPGRWAHKEQFHEETSKKAASGVWAMLMDNIPTSLVKPLAENQVIGVILIALAFGIAMRRLRHLPMTSVGEIIEMLFQAILIVLHWIINVVPLAVFGIVASIVGVKGFQDFYALGAFVMAVILALVLQASWYLVRIRFGSWVRPPSLLRGMRDALIMAFSTGSSTATMPVTYECLTRKVGLRPESASLGSLVGSNFNNDGTALYEAMAALFISQVIGMQLTLGQQVTVILTSIIASVGAAGIPEAGLVTMTLVFTAVGLPVKYIAILLTVDWFLDRCRTTINVMGDVNVSCLLDGKVRDTTRIEPTPVSIVEPAPRVA
ncbi:MAG: dicarboxylate/amino acid:cation symporter [Candidatus Sumerlaeaceae bacterium]